MSAILIINHWCRFIPQEGPISSKKILPHAISERTKSVTSRYSSVLDTARAHIDLQSSLPRINLPDFIITVNSVVAHH